MSSVAIQNSSCCTSLRNYCFQKKEHLLTAWTGELYGKPVSLRERAYHLAMAVPIIDLIVRLVEKFFTALAPASVKKIYATKLPEGARIVKELPNGVKIVELPNGLKRIDRDYRVVDPKLIPGKLAEERKRAVEFQEKQVFNPHFAAARDDGFTFLAADKIGRPGKPATADICTLASEEHTLHYQGKQVRVNISSTQGRRGEMEDEHIAMTFQVKGVTVPVFGLFDGHGGGEASAYLKNNMAAFLQKHLEAIPGPLTNEAIFQALKDVFVDLDDHFANNQPGSTACLTFRLNGMLWAANIGDSRAVLERPDGTFIPLTRDANPEEQIRDISEYSFDHGIINRGGFVDRGAVAFGGVPRVNGLAVARAIGDHWNVALQGPTAGCQCITPRCKIIAIPDSEIPPGSRIVAGCDGLWDQATDSTQVRGLSDKQLVYKGFNTEPTVTIHRNDNISVLTALFVN